MKQTSNSVFCVLPFFSYENRRPGNAKENQYCCRLDDSSLISEVRQDILSGNRHKGCSACWKLEDQDLTSERQLHNSALDFYWDRDIQNIQADVHQGIYSTRMVKLHTSNLCNATCVTCGPNFSSAWASLTGQAIHYDTILPEDIVGIDWSNIQSLSFVGGEPLLEKNNFRILEILSQAGNNSCFVSFVTNGSIDLSQKQIDILAGFHNLNICVSIDAVGKKFEYLRFPLKWSKLNQNLATFSAVTKNISVSCMISNISLFGIDETLDWFHDQSLKFLCKQIEHPAYFAPGNMPLAAKQELLASTKYPKEVQAFIKMGQHSDSLWHEFQNKIRYQDQLKNTSIRSYFGENAITKIF